MGQQFQTNRVSPVHHSGIGPRINPRWLPGLEFGPNVNEFWSDFSLASVYTPYVLPSRLSTSTLTASSGNARNTIGFDIHGPTPKYTGTASGSESIHTPNSVVTTPSTGLSMTVWGKFNTIGNYNCPLIRGTLGAGNGHAYGFVCNNNVPALMQMVADSASGGEVFLNTGITPLTNRWYFFGLTVDGSVLRAYVDGVHVASAACVGFGAANNGGWQVCGDFTDSGNTQPTEARYPMVWRDRVLTASDMYDLYINPSPYSEGSMQASVLSLALIAGTAAAAPSAPTLPYIKKRHGGTSHGDIVRTVSADATCNLDDYVIECNTTSFIYLPAWASYLQSREFVVANTGTGLVTTMVADGSTIIGANAGSNAYQIAAGTSARFIAGSAFWIKI